MWPFTKTRRQEQMDAILVAMKARFEREPAQPSPDAWASLLSGVAGIVKVELDAAEKAAERRSGAARREALARPRDGTGRFQKGSTTASQSRANGRDCPVCRNPMQLGLTRAQILWHNGGHNGPPPNFELIDPVTQRRIE